MMAFKLAAAVTTLVATGMACDTQEELDIDSLPSGSLSHGGQGGLDVPAMAAAAAALTLLPQNEGASLLALPTCR